MSNQIIEIPLVVPIISTSKFSFLKPKETERTYMMKEAKICTIRRITKALQSLPEELIGETNIEVGIPLIANHIDTFIYVIASAIQNDFKEPSADLLDFLAKHLTRELMFEGFNNAIFLLGINDFLNTYAVIKSTAAIINRTDS